MILRITFDLRLLRQALQGSFTETPFFRSLLELQGEGHLEEALDEYDEAIRLDLQTPPGYNNRGSAYNGWGSSSRPLRIMVHEIGFPCFEARIPVVGAVPAGH